MCCPSSSSGYGRSGTVRFLATLSMQAARFGTVGLLSNALLYLLYLRLTSIGTGPKVAMSVLFLSGTLLTFVLNRRWTFSHSGDARRALVRYVSAYGTAYLLNLAALWVFVDLMGLPHQLVQASAVLTLAGLLFLAQRFWVFRSTAQL